MFRCQLLNKKILLVDDEEVFRSVLKDELMEEGANVIEAHDGMEAVTLLEQQRFDLFITDTYLPKLNGDEIIDQMQKKKIHVPSLVLFATHPIYAKSDDMKLEFLHYIEADTIILKNNPIDLIARKAKETIDDYTL
jgi:CheY-like chemotaxis protein